MGWYAGRGGLGPLRLPNSLKQFDNVWRWCGVRVHSRDASILVLELVFYLVFGHVGVRH